MCRWAQRRKDTTGKMFPVFFVSLAIIAAFLSTGVFLAGEHLSFNYPQLKGLNYRGGGRVPLTAFVLWFGLTVYTAAFIAENVRGGILAVSHGQSEAASSLGLYRRITLQLIIIPQAMRVIVPPTISQFLNLTKNSSLAVAVGYPDLVNVWSGIALNQTGQALVKILQSSKIITAITMVYYETIQCKDQQNGKPTS
jgi:general L-amino acid transport system permease protein